MSRAKRRSSWHFRTGLRVSELLALKWEDIRFDTGEIRPARAIVDQVIGALKTEASGKAVPMDTVDLRMCSSSGEGSVRTTRTRISFSEVLRSRTDATVLAGQSLAQGDSSRLLCGRESPSTSAGIPSGALGNAATGKWSIGQGNSGHAPTRKQQADSGTVRAGSAGDSDCAISIIQAVERRVTASVPKRSLINS